MGKYAILEEYVVIEVKDMSDAEVLVAQKDLYHQIVDVTNDNPVPQVGWVFNGSTVKPIEVE